MIRSAVLAACLEAAPLWAAELDPQVGVQITGVLPDGAVVVRNGDSDFVCDLIVGAAAAELTACKPVSLSGAAGAGSGGLARDDAAALLAGMSDAAWERLVQEIFVGAGCRIDIVGGEARVIELAGTAIGISPESIARLRDELFIRADRAIVGLTSAGTLTVRDGALVLEDCP